MSALFNRGWKEILGLNARTLHYIKSTTLPSAGRIANKKLATKRALQKAGIPTPRLFAAIRSHRELKRFRWTKLPSSFVLKPNSASGGGGILVIFGRNKKGNWVKGDKTEIFIPELKNQILDILDGNYSPSNVPDIALFEQRVKVTADLKPYATKGVPDIRILVYNQTPVMAMLRLPTEESGGRANLHAGGIGVGIDLALGLTTTAIQRGQSLEMLPGSRRSLSGIQLPNWNQILLTAVKAAQAIGLNFAGVDIAIDREDGPLVLEINARPGLDIQFANMAPLKSRLRRVEGLSVPSPEKGVALAKNLFGSGIEQEIEDILGRAILGIEEKIKVFDAEGQPHALKAKIDTGAWRTTINQSLARKLAIHKLIIEHKQVRGALGRQKRPVIEMTFALRERTIKTQAFMTDRSHMNYDMIIGRRDLKGFLVDPSKKLTS